MYGAPLDPEEWSSVTVPTLVTYGDKSPAVLRDGSRELAQVLPNAELREVKGVGHNLKVDVLAPVLAQFHAADTEVPPPGYASRVSRAPS